jgi:hypothetical protein
MIRRQNQIQQERLGEKPAPGKTYLVAPRAPPRELGCCVRRTLDVVARKPSAARASKDVGSAPASIMTES